MEDYINISCLEISQVDAFGSGHFVQFDNNRLGPALLGDDVRGLYTIFLEAFPNDPRSTPFAGNKASEFNQHTCFGFKKIEFEVDMRSAEHIRDYDAKPGQLIRKSGELTIAFNRIGNFAIPDLAYATLLSGLPEATATYAFNRWRIIHHELLDANGSQNRRVLWAND